MRMLLLVLLGASGCVTTSAFEKLKAESEEGEEANHELQEYYQTQAKKLRADTLQAHAEKLQLSTRYEAALAASKAENDSCIVLVKQAAQQLQESNAQWDAYNKARHELASYGRIAALRNPIEFMESLYGENWYVRVVVAKVDGVVSDVEYLKTIYGDNWYERLVEAKTNEPAIKPQVAEAEEFELVEGPIHQKPKACLIENRNRLAVGMNQSQVRAILGAPTSTDAFKGMLRWHWWCDSYYANVAVFKNGALYEF